ncbi:methyltransferase 6 [Brachionus plicatilis]|uniref:tRNA N(3)-methylcytidine methyltransferase n=1 Tax=Brachionus plicatilis TaxID=10195 RepID=A0A3M7T0R8_BRAPC|nr:methyltransferase 6 [Brachionus plicatilis]
MNLNNELTKKLNITEKTGLENADSPTLESDVPFQNKGYMPRELSVEERNKLESDNELVSEFKRRKFEQEAKKNWDLFYRRNKTNFFKDRYWTFREFDELNEDYSLIGESPIRKLLEIGCGVGNFMYPLLNHNKSIFVYACDFSTDAINLLKSNAEYDTNRCHGFVCDITMENSLRECLPQNVEIDAVTLIFVLSAIHPDKMKKAVESIAQVLRPGGIVFVRDYGMYDHSMIRFDKGHKLDEKFYVRQDGTRTFFFSLEEIENLFTKPSPTGHLFHKSSNEYVFRETVNVKENLRVPRVFIQSKFVRSNIPVL